MVLTIIAAILLISERVRSDLVAMLIMVLLGLSGIVSVQETFSGFSSSAVITLLGISIISEGLHQTGFTNRLGRWMKRVGGKSSTRLIAVTMVTAAGLSLFMNNIAAVGILLPAVMTLSRQSRVSASRLLLPLAFGTLLGGMATLLTTSNIIVSGALREAGYQSFGLLDFFPIGGPLVVVGIGYMLLVGQKFLPDDQMHRIKPDVFSQEMANLYDLNRVLRELVVLENSPLAGRTLQQLNLSNSLGINLVGVTHKGDTHLALSADYVIESSDILLVLGDFPATILSQFGLALMGNVARRANVSSDTTVMAEIVITPHSSLIGKTLREVSFRNRYQVNVLAVWREGGPLQCGLADVRVKFGDALLVHGSAENIHLLHQQPDMVVLQEDPDAVLRPRKQLRALVITLVTLGIAALDLLPVALVVMTGAVLMVLAGCLSTQDIYQNVEWKALFLIAGMWPLSIAIRTTGLAGAVVESIVSIFGTVSPLVVAAILLLIALVLVQFMSGQVAALVLAPLALTAAQAIGVDARGLAMAVALGCSLCFPTPYGHPVNIMVMNPGGYHFRDFVRIGLPLTVILLPLILLGLRLLWGI